MSVPGTPEGCERIAYVLGRREESMFSDTYGGGGDVIGLDCHLVRPINKRSKAVLNALANLGVDRTRITAVGMGEDFPIASNETEDGKGRNRRVDVILLDE